MRAHLFNKEERKKEELKIIISLYVFSQLIMAVINRHKN